MRYNGCVNSQRRVKSANRVQITADGCLVHFTLMPLDKGANPLCSGYLLNRKAFWPLFPWGRQQVLEREIQNEFKTCPKKAWFRQAVYCPRRINFGHSRTRHRTPTNRIGPGIHDAKFNYKAFYSFTDTRIRVAMLSQTGCT